MDQGKGFCLPSSQHVGYLTLALTPGENHLILFCQLPFSPLLFLLSVSFLFTPHPYKAHPSLGYVTLP